MPLKISTLLNMLLRCAVIFILSNCGVKGDPLPPERPPDLGRGRPTYKKATEGLNIEKTTSGRMKFDDDEEEDDKDDKKNDE